MARVLENKELNNIRLATNYGGWMYCTNCNENIGYLCYVTYNRFNFEFNCKCGSHGSALLEFDSTSVPSNQKLVTIKNRLCCPEDQAPLVTIISKKLLNYKFEIICSECKKTYIEENH